LGLGRVCSGYQQKEENHQHGKKSAAHIFHFPNFEPHCKSIVCAKELANLLINGAASVFDLLSKLRTLTRGENALCDLWQSL
jgi:hypothetical protein